MYLNRKYLALLIFFFLNFDIDAQNEIQFEVQKDSISYTSGFTVVKFIDSVIQCNIDTSNVIFSKGAIGFLYIKYVLSCDDKLILVKVYVANGRSEKDKKRQLHELERILSSVLEFKKPLNLFEKINPQNSFTVEKPEIINTQ